ncbi:hypothetical protein [endosymbiont GvMRE of Glomus versiforme]|uniref:hypothetical protein n=1 Tax=endosymbiont GvMRE of Glomus versiforme TaxID=2039283 RepID=UPI000ED28A60|nr:hypothetical protein [endosymbiont GvMRE of Glomus versiforme]RHZ36651.1 hypothetical protein GvMRE_I2g98 [endosymbiont GvMRE of Glomus versiforme]
MKKLTDNLTIEKQREIIKKKFQDLKDEWLTTEQKNRVHCGELEEKWWVERRWWSNGFTFIWEEEMNGFSSLYQKPKFSSEDTIKQEKKKIWGMWVFIRLFETHEKLEALLEAIAHEFAHIRLIFKDLEKFSGLEYGHGEKHKKEKNLLLDYLLLQCQ